ncbi:hypothetical protein ACFX2J_020112 [Malus domestica]
MMRKPMAVICHPPEPFLFLLLKPFYSISSPATAPLPLSPEPHDLSAQLFSILSRPNWQRHPSLKKLAPSISPSHVSSVFALKLDPQTALGFFNWIALKPGYKHTVQCHSSLLNILLPNGFLQVAEKIRISMIKASSSPQDAVFVLEYLRALNGAEEFEFKLTLRCYNFLLMSLSKFSLFQDLKALYLEMLDDMVSPNLHTFNTMIHAYCKLGNVAEADLYFSKIGQAGLHPDTFTYTSLILGHCRNKDVDSGCSVFKLMPQKGCQRNEVSYTNLIHGFCEADRIDEALKLFSQMGEDNCFPTVRTFTVLICALCKLGRKIEAMNLFKEMTEMGCEPNVHTYTVLIDSMCKENKLDKARNLLNKMLEKRLVPNVVTYNAMIDGYCKEGAVEAALGILALMESSNCFPNARTYNELICGFCKRKNIHQAMALLGHLESAYRLLNLMKEGGLVPDQWSYSSLIDTLCKKGRLEEAHALFDSLKEKGIKLNDVIFTALIDGYCTVGKIDDAHSLFDRMLVEDCLPNSYTYNTLIDVLCKEGRLKEALSLVEKMVSIGVKATVHTYTILIKQMLKEGDFDHAHRLLNQMVSSGNQPDLFTYTTFIHAYCGIGNVEEAEKLMIKMNEEGIVADSLTYTLLIDGYGRMGLIDCAFDVLKRMFDASCDPSHYTYSFLIKHLSNEKLTETRNNILGMDLISNVSLIDIADVWKIMDFDIALDLFEKMTGHGCAPSTNTYDKLIVGLCKERRLEEAQRLYSHMKEREVSPSEDIYNYLLNCCCTLQKYGEAAILVDAMIEDGYLPTLESSTLLVCGLLDEEKSEKAKAVFRTLLHCEYNYDEVAWKVLFDGLLKRGLGNICSELISIMEKLGCRLHPQTYSMLIEGIDSPYLKVPREDGLEISELAIDDAKSELYHSINRCMKKSEVQRMSSALALMFDVVHSSFHLFICTISVTYRVARMLVRYCNEDLVRLSGAEPAELGELGGKWLAIVNETLLQIPKHQVAEMREEVIRLIPRVIYADPRAS